MHTFPNLENILDTIRTAPPAIVIKRTPTRKDEYLLRCCYIESLRKAELSNCKSVVSIIETTSLYNVV